MTSTTMNTTTSASVAHAIPLRQAGEGHILCDHIVGDEGIAPGFASMLCGVGRGILAPFDGGVALREDNWIFQLIAGFGFEHVDGVGGLGDEVGLIFGVVSTLAVEDLELTPGRLEPLEGVAFEDDSEAALGVGLEFLHGVETADEAAKEIFVHVALISRGDSVLERCFTDGVRIGAWLQFGEAFADHDFVAGSLFPVVILHLGMNEASDIPLVGAQNLLGVILGEVGAEVLDGLPGEVVEQVGVVVVGDIVEIDRAN